jgi:integrase
MQVRRRPPSYVIAEPSTCVIDAVLKASPAAYVRRPPVPNESPTLGLSHLQFEAMIVAARTSTNPFDFALVAMLGLLGLRVFEACQAEVDDVGEQHGHRVLRVLGKGTKLALIPLPPAVGRAIDRAVDDRVRGPILLNRNGNRMDRHAATRRLRRPEWRGVGLVGVRADQAALAAVRAGSWPLNRTGTQAVFNRDRIAAWVGVATPERPEQRATGQRDQ